MMDKGHGMRKHILYRKLQRAASDSVVDKQDIITETGRKYGRVV